jgi:hypothetical protein
MTMPPLDLRSAAPTPPAAPPVQPTLPPGVAAQAGSQPFAPGTVFTLTPQEEANLATLGFSPDSVAVASLPEYLKTLTTADVGPGLTQPPPTIDISQLPAAKQAEMRASILQAQQAVANAAQLQASMVATPSSPDVNRAIAEMAQPAPMFPNQISGTSTPAAEKPDFTPAPAMATAAHDPICPHCSQDTTVAPIQVPDEMKRDFLLMLAGGRLTHRFELMGGAVCLTYRNLTRLEDDTILTQVAYDEAAGRIPSPGEYIRQAENYRMMLSLAAIEVQGPQPIMERLPELSEVQHDPLDKDGHKQTAVRPLIDYIHDRLITTMYLRRLTAEYGLRFGDLLNACTRQAASPDFWRGIATRG